MEDFSAQSYEYLTKNLGKRINYEMHNRGWDQKTLAKNSNQSQSTISNIISGKTTVSMKTIFEVMEILEMDPLSELAMCGKSTTGSSVVQADSLRHLLHSISPNLICDPDNIAFRGQMGHYYIYFHSTNRHNPQCLRGDLTLYNEHQICKVRLQIDTRSSSDETADKDSKIYNGIASISPIQQAVYVILVNESIGEMSFLAFPYHQILTKERQIECTMAMALTVSSGIDSRLPTAHRMFLSRKLLDSKSEALILAQLLMNKSLIRISEEQFHKMLTEKTMDPYFLDYFQKHMTMKTYREIDEDTFKQLIRNNPDFFDDLCTLREYSTAPKNNKINQSVISYIYHWVIEKLM